jgi:ribonuclease T
VDIESAGPIPEEYSMLSIGACVVGKEDEKENNFYVELQPISDKYETGALEVTGFSIDYLKDHGTPIKEAMINFSDWIIKVSDKKRPIFVGSPVVFDWSFVNYYFHKFIGSNPFGLSGLDLKSLWIGKTNSKWNATGIKAIKKVLGLEHLVHSHNALEDAKEQALIFAKIMEK